MKKNKRKNPAAAAKSNERHVDDTHELVRMLHLRGISQKTICRVLDTMIDIGVLSTAALVEVKDQVMQFLHKEIPEPSDNSMINVAVIGIMMLIIQDIEGEDYSPVL